MFVHISSILFSIINTVYKAERNNIKIKVWIKLNLNEHSIFSNTVWVPVGILDFRISSVNRIMVLISDYS